MEEEEEEEEEEEVEVCLATDLQAVPKQVMQRVQCSSSSSNFRYLLDSLMPSNNCLGLGPPTFPPIPCFRRPLLGNMRPIQ
jgi:hypothetical protein